MLAQTAPTATAVTSPEVVLDCPDCLAERLFVTPGCEADGIGCDERLCLECGAAVVLVPPTARPAASRKLRHVA
jgi:hypothetical protein